MGDAQPVPEANVARLYLGTGVQSAILSDASLQFADPKLFASGGTARDVKAH